MSNKEKTKVSDAEIQAERSAIESQIAKLDKEIAQKGSLSMNDADKRTSLVARLNNLKSLNGQKG